MADNANGNGGKAPRTLFSLGRSGGKRGSKRGGNASALESYPPLDPDMAGAGAVAVDDEPRDAAAEAACESCGTALVPGAMFCGECGTRVASPEDASPPAGGDEPLDQAVDEPLDQAVDEPAR